MDKRTVFCVWEGTEYVDGMLGSEGIVGTEFSGYAYTDRELAEKHASNVWLGSVKEITVYDTIPEWVADMIESRQVKEEG
jgi:hypothetical protein